MKAIFALAIAAAAFGTLAPVPALAQVSATIGINQPGVYGRIHIGDVPPPALYRSEPVIVARPRVVVQQAPVYLYVPPAHQQNWQRYCGRYRACGQPVYFVRDEWVRDRYEHEHPGWDRGRHRGWDKHDKHEDRDDRGHGRGHDKGKDKHGH
ncbi:MAG: hypothetical protein ABI281_07210 [Caldimonas sp.]